MIIAWKTNSEKWMTSRWWHIEFMWWNNFDFLIHIENILSITMHFCNQTQINFIQQILNLYSNASLSHLCLYYYLYSLDLMKRGFNKSYIFSLYICRNETATEKVLCFSLWCCSIFLYTLFITLGIIPFNCDLTP